MRINFCAAVTIAALMASENPTNALTLPTIVANEFNHEFELAQSEAASAVEDIDYDEFEPAFV